MTDIIGSNMLNTMRGAIDRLLPDTCHVLSATSAPDGFGGSNLPWGTASYYVPCRADYSNGRELSIGGRVSPFYGYIFTMPYDTTITASNHISHNGNVYAVIHVNDDPSWKLSKRVYCERV